MCDKELTVKELFEFVQREKPEGYGRCRLVLFHDGTGHLDAGHSTVVALSWHDLDDLHEKLRTRNRERAVQRVVKAARSVTGHAHYQLRTDCTICVELSAAIVALGACHD